MKLIDKDALVAEIRRMIKNAELYIEHHSDNNDRLRYSFEHQRLAMCELLSFLDTLEVKDVDLDKEIKDYFNNQPIVTRFKGTDYKLVPNAEKIAKHFFELGLKLQKEE